MLAKAKRFITNPVYLLAAIVSLAVLGTGVYYSFNAFASGVQYASDEYIDAHFNHITVDYVVGSSNGPYMQIVVADKEGTEVNETLTYDGPTDYFDYDYLCKSGSHYDISSYHNDVTDEG